MSSVICATEVALAIGAAIAVRHDPGERDLRARGTVPRRDA